MSYFVTWYESEQAEKIEDILDGKEIDIDMLPTPSILREQDVMICKDCFELFLDKKDILHLATIHFPEYTTCFSRKGELVWKC